MGRKLEYIVHGGVASGKTHRAIELLKKHPATKILCISEDEKNRLIYQYGIDRLRIITLNLMQRERGSMTPLIADNADMILSSIVGRYGYWLQGITLGSIPTDWPEFPVRKKWWKKLFRWKGGDGRHGRKSGRQRRPGRRFSDLLHRKSD